MTLGGFTHEHFVPPAPPPRQARRPGRACRRCRRHLVPRRGRTSIDGDPAIVGKPIRFAEVATTIAGVAPKRLRHAARRRLLVRQQLAKDDINHFFDGFMRLKPGATIERANAEMASVMTGLARDFPAVRQEPRLRHQAARRLGRRGPRPDPASS